MVYSLDDTIAAIASARGGAARGIVRISGPAAAECLAAIVRQRPSPAPWRETPHTLVFQTELELAGLALLPAEVIFWPDQRSYTGQSAAEIHTLGSPPLLQHVLEALCAAGARLAERGEFTMRAFLSGRIDLTEAEAVLGTIEAADNRQLDAALVQLAGGIADPLHRLRQSILGLLAHLEAGLDFPDEDLPFLNREDLRQQLQAAVADVDRLAERMAKRVESSETVRVVLTGRPNVGKSSLFNALARDAKALVSNIPGTTRDYLVADLDFGGVRCRLIDTAGIDERPGQPADDVERAAREMAERQSGAADVLLVCVEGGAAPGATLSEDHPGAGPCRIIVETKADLRPAESVSPAAVVTSALTGAGIAELESRLRDAVLAASSGEGDVVAGTAVRCRVSLEAASAALQGALRLAASSGGEELIAAEMRVALGALGRVVGAVYTDDLLDQIFSRFCIGK